MNFLCSHLQYTEKNIYIFSLILFPYCTEDLNKNNRNLRINCISKIETGPSHNLQNVIVCKLYILLYSVLDEINQCVFLIKVEIIFAI